LQNSQGAIKKFFKKKEIKDELEGKKIEYFVKLTGKEIVEKTGIAASR